MQIGILDKCVITAAMAIVAAVLSPGTRRAVAASMSVAVLTWLYPLIAVGFASMSLGYLFLFRSDQRRGADSVNNISNLQHHADSTKIIDAKFVTETRDG